MWVGGSSVLEAPIGPAMGLLCTTSESLLFGNAVTVTVTVLNNRGCASRHILCIAEWCCSAVSSVRRLPHSEECAELVSVGKGGHVESYSCFLPLTVFPCFLPTVLSAVQATVLATGKNIIMLDLQDINTVLPAKLMLQSQCPKMPR